MRSMLPTKRMAISIIARHSGLSATQQSRSDIKEASIRILSPDYRRGLLPLVLHRTYLLKRGQLTEKLLRAVCPGRRRDASRLRESRRSENSNRSKPIKYRFWECRSTRVRG